MIMQPKGLILKGLLLMVDELQRPIVHNSVQTQAGIIIKRWAMMKSYLLKKEFFINNHKDQIKEHFQFIKEIGRGAYGVVYQARQKTFPNHLRVIKRISKRRVKNPTVLINQIKIMAILDHPHIIKVYETFEDQNSLFLVMDFCEGGQLYNRLCSLKIFSEGKARAIFQQMVTAVRYMHAQHVAHRDLKLENFMMVNNNSWAIMLIDFGLSFRWSKDMKSEVSAAEKGKIIGTPYYIAPEILAHDYSEKCDIWSLGVILYMLVTGTPPFDGQNDKAIMANTSAYNYSLNTPQCQKLSPSLLDLISKIFQPEASRLSLEGILEHPWMVKQKQFDDVLLNLQFKQLMEFSRFDKLKKLVATYIATQLSQNEIESIRDIFLSIDDNQDGYITVEELHQFLNQRQGQNVALNDLQKIVLSIDTDRNGKINYNEFIAMCIDEAIMSSDDYMRFAFNSFDLNRDGKIQREEFQLILKAYSKDFNCNEELVDALMNENDKNNDGVIDFQEFKHAISSVRSIAKQRKSSHAMEIE